MDATERKVLRRRFGQEVINIQNNYMQGYPIEDVLSETISALLSLAAYIAKNNADIDAIGFQRACEMAREEQWPA
jgi:hypothetical protein